MLIEYVNNKPQAHFFSEAPVLHALRYQSEHSSFQTDLAESNLKSNGLLSLDIS